MIRTGDESHLGTPIPFEQIINEALKLNKNGSDLDGIEVVRVPLSTAVHYFINLQQREDTTMASQDPVVDRSFCPATDRDDFGDLLLSAEAWAKSILHQ